MAEDDNDSSKSLEGAPAITGGYMTSLIDQSDLMVTEEEKDLFPNVHEIQPISKEQTTVYLTEISEVEKPEKRIELDILINEHEEDTNVATSLSLVSKKLNQYINENDDGNEIVKTNVSEYSEENDDDDLDNNSLFDHEELWDTDLEIDSDELNGKKDHSTAAKYLEHCSKLEIVPAKYYLHNMDKPVLSMKYHGLGPLGTKAIAKSLESNIAVDTLDLSGNAMQLIGVNTIAKMLEENNFIQRLIISDNMIGDQGVTALCRALTINNGLKHLDLSGNHITSNGCTDLSDLMEKSKNLTELIVSRNDIDTKGAYFLGAGIASNDILEVLDLSWNKIHGEGAYSIARGLKENIRIKHCNLSFNGFSKEGGLAIAETIKDNSVLTSLNIEGNRINGEIAIVIGKALTCNESLEELFMGFNPINTSGALGLLTAINSYDNSPLKLLSFKDIPVDFETVKTIEHIRLKRPKFNCIHGLEIAVGNTQEDMNKRMVNPKHPIIMLKEHLIINNESLVDVLQRLDSTGSHSVTVDQFSMALEELGIPFKKSQILDIKARLDRKGNGTIYYGDFISKVENQDENKEESRGETQEETEQSNEEGIKDEINGEIIENNKEEIEENNKEENSEKYKEENTEEFKEETSEEMMENV